MSSLEKILDIARRGLATQQAALNVTGHNIANANTVGYSRQRVLLQASSPESTVNGLLGSGVDVQRIERIRDEFIDSEIRTEQQNLSRWEFNESTLAEVEGIFNEPSDTGLSTVLQSFWDSWAELADDPQSGSSRLQVKQVGIQLANTFKQLHTRLTNLQEDLNQELTYSMKEVNSLLQQVASLNEKIGAAETQGVTAADYRDQRGVILQKLSEFMDVRVTEGETGMVSVTVGGKILVERNTVWELSTASRSMGGDLVALDPVWAEDGSVVTISGGKIKGILEMRDEAIEGKSEDLDEMARAIVESVNAIHRTGYGSDGSTDNDFFDVETTGAADIALDTGVLNSVTLIAASADGSTGNGDIAVQIGQLRDEKNPSLGSVTIGDYFSSMMATLGVISQEAQFMNENEQLLLEQLEIQQSSVSGVSLDEEMTNLIKYQHAYEAAARLVTTVDEMMQTLIEMV